MEGICDKVGGRRTVRSCVVEMRPGGGRLGQTASRQVCATGGRVGERDGKIGSRTGSDF